MNHRFTIVLACVVLGVLPLFQLDGQSFTNALIALPFFLAATASALRRPRVGARRNIERGHGDSCRH